MTNNVDCTQENIYSTTAKQIAEISACNLITEN